MTPGRLGAGHTRDIRPEAGRAAKAPLVVTMGEPAGIAAEITLMAWLARRPEMAFFVIADPGHLESLAAKLGLAVPVARISSAHETEAVFERALPVLPMTLSAPVQPGTIDPAQAPSVIAAIEKAVSITMSGVAAAMVTNPIHKKALYDAGFAHAGHTEFLAALAGSGEAPVMMLACPGLRVVPVTVHLPLVKALATLSTQMIVHAGEITAEALRRDFGIAKPRLAVAGVNPHAGEDGALGSEEAEIIAPAIAALRAQGHEVTGPEPADALFHKAARAGYDAALCMYHDQALIPLKTVDFDRGVNITLGLPFVRTSPDHGTALGIAGQGTASPNSLIAALETAQAMADARALA